MSNRKNILFILTDDQGAWAMGCSGNRELHTPNLDRLATEGTRLENFYCVSPVCSPARVSLMTGKIPSSHGVHDWLDKGQNDEESLSDELKTAFSAEHPDQKYIWPRYQLKGDRGIEYIKGHRTFTEVLHDNGYECGLSGKWHAGAANRPQAGFDFWHTCAMGGADYYNQVFLEDGEMRLLSGTYITDHITDRAIDFLDGRDGEKPFCLCVNYTAPHSPWAEGCHPEEYMSMYRDCPFDSIPNDPPHPWCGGVDQSFAEWKSKPHPGVRFIRAKYAPIRETWQEYRRESLTGYFAAVTAMDANVGRLLDYLDEHGLAEDTLVVFTSDNGSNMGHHGIFGKGNGTYPVNMYQTSTRVPGLFRCPGTVPSGVVSQGMFSHYDVYETLLDFVGIDFTPTDDMPGHSFAPLLRGEGDGVDADGAGVVVYDEYGRTRMICDGKYKLIRRYPAGPDEFYDLTLDPDEYENRLDAPEYAGIISDMTARLGEWFSEYVDPRFDGSVEDVRGKGQISSHEFLK